jgi:pimeloyl-ACP methyl ester carboxylesterase
MRRLLFAVLILVGAAIALPPLWFAIFPGEPPPELPPAGRYVMLPGGAGVNVIEQGSGPAVVLVHGLPGSAYDWRELSPELAKRGRRAIAYGRVGFGRSDPRTNGQYTPEGNAAELLALLEALELEDATVVGHSYGGATAMIASLRDSSRMGRLVLVATGGPDSADAQPPMPSALLRAFYSVPALRWRTAVPPIGVALMRVLSDQAFNGQPQPDWWLPGLRANLARWDTLLAYRGEMMGVGADAGAALVPEQIALPTLLLHGDADRLASVEISRYLASQIPGATLVEYPGASHMLIVTHAADLAEQISTFSAE